MNALPAPRLAAVEYTAVPGLLKTLAQTFEPCLEASYQDTYTRESMVFVRAMIVLGLFIYLLFGIWDYLLFPEQKDKLWLIRGGGVAPVLVLAFVSTYHRSLQPHWQSFLMVATVVAIAALVSMMFILPDGAAMTHIHPGIQMCLMFCFTAFKLRFVHALGVGLVGVGMFHWAGSGPLAFPPNAMISSAFFLTGSLFTGALTAWLLERYSRDAFLQQRENDRLIVALETEKRVAIEANASKTRFLAAASHDLRQPLHAIGLLVDILRDRSRDAELRSLGDSIHRAVRAMEGQFSSLLDISRLDAGDVEAGIRPVSIDALIESLAAVHAPAARAKGIGLELNGNGLQVMSDPALLERTLGNLIDNAIKYTDVGHVSLTAHSADQMIRIDVVDTGRGFPAEMKSRIFEEFFQIGNPARDREQGLGIGLAIVRRLATLLEHELTVDSAPGKGSCFSLHLPRAPAKVICDTAHESMSDTQTEDDLLIGTFVVVIDDEAGVREAMCTVLNSWGCHVLSARSADDALEQLGSHLRDPDLILSDYRLGEEQNGVEAIRRIRAACEQSVPAIIVTGDPYGHGELAQDATDIGLTQKPIHGARLRQLLISRLRAGKHSC